MAVCEKCPLNAVLDTAQEIVNVVDHPDKERTLGGISITHEVLTRVSDKLDCPGAVSNSNNQLDCPLRETVFGARGMATGPWPASQFIVDLTQGVVNAPKQEHDSAHGTYI